MCRKKKKNNPKGFCPISLNNTHVSTYFREGQFEKKKADQTTETKFHRSKNSLIQLFLKSHCPKCHYFLSFLNICNTFILHGPGNKTVHILLTKLLFSFFQVWLDEMNILCALLKATKSFQKKKKIAKLWFWIFMPKIVKIQQFSTFVDSVFTQNHDFWREKSNYPGKSDI